MLLRLSMCCSPLGIVRRLLLRIAPDRIRRQLTVMHLPVPGVLIHGVVLERLLCVSWAFSRLSRDLSPVCHRVVQVVHGWFEWFTNGSSGSPMVRVVHRWFKRFKTALRSPVTSPSLFVVEISQGFTCLLVLESTGVHWSPHWFTMVHEWFTRRASCCRAHLLA